MALRSLQRLFKTKFGKTPERVYLDIRLAQARLLVQRSDKSIRDIAAATGFASPSQPDGTVHAPIRSIAPERTGEAGSWFGI